MKQKLIIAMCLSTFVCMMDTTIMNIALPVIQKNLETNLNNVSWALNIYTIIFAAFTIPLSRLVDRVGRNKGYIIGIIIFLIGSVLCGLANNIIELVIYRGIKVWVHLLYFQLAWLLLLKVLIKSIKKK